MQKRREQKTIRKAILLVLVVVNTLIGSGLGSLLIELGVVQTVFALSNNVTTINMYRGPGTQGSLLGYAWVNDNPYLAWSGASADGGIGGYCLYLGDSSGVDPVSNKGLLGVSSVVIGSATCPYQITTAYIELRDTATHGATWLTARTEPYYFSVRALDSTGTPVDGDVAEAVFYYDDQNPLPPAYISLPGNYVSSKQVTFTWPTSGPNYASDVGAGVQSLQYKINNGPWQGDAHTGTGTLDDVLVNDGSYTMTYAYDYSLLKEGNNTLAVRAIDASGLSSISYASGIIKLNSNASSAPLNLQVTPTSNDANAYAFSWSAPEVFTGAESGITYCYTVNTQPSLADCTYTAPGVTTLSASAYATRPGTNTFYVAARDEAGNISYVTTAQQNFTYTGSAPGMPLDIAVSDISVKSTQSWRLVVSWHAPSDVGTGIAKYQILRSDTNANCSSNPEAFTLVGTTTNSSYANSELSQQTYYYCVQACDSANNCSAPSATASLFPTGRYLEAAALVSTPVVSDVGTHSATISWITSRGSDSRVAFGTSSGSYFDAEPSNSTQTITHNLPISNLEPNTKYYFIAKWTDEDGNIGTSEEGTFMTSPAPRVKGVQVLSVNIDRALIQFTSVGATSVEVHYGSTMSFGGVQRVITSALESTYVVELTGLSDDTNYFYQVTPMDSEGFRYLGTILNLETLPAPEVTNVLVEEEKDSATPTLTISWQTNAPTTSVITYSPMGQADNVFTQADMTFIEGEHRIKLSNLQTATMYNLEVSGSDQHGNATNKIAVHFQTALDLRLPRVSDVRMETVISTIPSSGSDEPKAQIIVSWDTDEASTGQIEYGQGSLGSYSGKTQLDPDFSYNHVVVVSNLVPSSVYHLRIVSVDEAGNMEKTLGYIMVTAKATDSAVDLVVGNLADIFSFLR